MIISDEHKFVFVHVPKCAGTSVRHALRPIDSTGGAFREIVEHPVMGRVHLAHLTLADLREFFPDASRKVREYQSVAIVRDPFDRFVSAVFQRLREFGGIGQSAITPAMIEAEASSVIDLLESAPARLNAEHVHFNRQADFIFLDNERVVHSVFPLQRLSEAARLIGDRTGVSIGDNRKNRTTELSISSLRSLQRLLRGPYARLVPADRRTRIREQMTRAGFYRDVPKQRFKSADGRMEQFVQRYYSKDFEIYWDSLNCGSTDHE